MSEGTWRLWRHRSGLTLKGGRKVEVEVYVPADYEEYQDREGDRYIGHYPYGDGWVQVDEVPIRIPKNAGYETENRPPEISTPGGTIPARALLELYEEVT